MKNKRKKKVKKSVTSQDIEVASGSGSSSSLEKQQLLQPVSEKRAPIAKGETVEAFAITNINKVDDVPIPRDKKVLSQKKTSIKLSFPKEVKEADSVAEDSISSQSVQKTAEKSKM